ncbi:uncharacterized protein LOC121413828 [Lytechinus variegatus]|uniref:uncharacterized protein LOC121413828 n=1 Tax=Lytechinus variegatus TaxID=7654 RepID=UPI001BB1A384|nr:uncharacterized protein LOC121413828 [Lytechinus variegatus]
MNRKTNLLSLIESRIAQRKGVQTYLQRSRRKRSRTALRFRRRLGTDEQTSANISIISITTYQGLNLSSPSLSTINDSNSSGGANSSSESPLRWSSSWSSASSTYLEDDIHVNRTNSVPYNLDNRRLLRNRSSHLNISNFLRNTRCRVNISDLAPESNGTSRSRTRRGVESEGCQVLNVNHGYIRVDQTGLVTTTWDGSDVNTRLYIFSIGPGYSRIKGIAADRYIHMDEAGSVRGIPASQIPEPYDASDSRGAWYESPGWCYESQWIQWYRKGGVRNQLKWYLAFNLRGRPIRVQRTHAGMCNAMFTKTLSTGVSCNPNDGGYTNN